MNICRALDLVWSVWYRYRYRYRYRYKSFESDERAAAD